MPGERTPEADMESRYYRWFAVGLACLLEGFTSGEPGVAAITLLFLLACQSELAGVWSASALCFLSLDRAGLPVTRPALLAVQVAAAALLAHRGRLVRPIPEAKITYVGQELNPQIAGRDGRFTSYPLPAGTVSLQVEAEGFVAKSFDVAVPDTGDVEQQLGLEEEINKGTISAQVATMR